MLLANLLIWLCLLKLIAASSYSDGQDENDEYYRYVHQQGQPQSDPEDYDHSNPEDYDQDFQGNSGGGQRKGDESALDFHIYQLIDRMRSLTPHATLYQLFNVRPEASLSEISANFRQLSLQWHPDKKRHASNGKSDVGKDREHAEAMYGLLSAASDVLQRHRARYDWILNEAPPWHRSSTLLAGRIAKTRHLQGWLIACLSVGFAVAGHWAAMWAAWAYKAQGIWAARRRVRFLGEKELKRLERKRLETNNTSTSDLVNSDLQALIESKQAMPPYPSISDVFLIQWMLGIFLWPVRLILRRRQ